MGLLVISKSVFVLTLKWIPLGYTEQTLLDRDFEKRFPQQQLFTNMLKCKILNHKRLDQDGQQMNFVANSKQRDWHI